MIFVSVIPPAFATAVDLTDEEINGLTTPVKNVASTADFRVDGVNTMIADTPTKYLFKPASGDEKTYILLKNVNADESDGYFVMVQDGGLKADSADSAIAKLRKVYPGTSADGTTQAPTVVFDKDDKKSIAYYLNTSDYIDAQFPVMKDYINDHTWYTEGTTKNEVNPYKTDAKIALPSVTEYKANVDRIGVNSVAKGQSSAFSPVHFMLRTAHPGWIDSKHTSSKYTTKAVWLAKNNKGTLTMQNESAVFYWQNVERPCFYLNEDFFKNVKIDESYFTDDALVTEIIKGFDVDTLKNAGYSDALLVKLGILKGSTEIATLTVDGETQVGCTLSAEYELADGFEQSEYTKFSWEYSDTQDGGFTAIDGADKKYFTVTANLNKKYVRVNVTLGNIDGQGETYTSDAVYIETLPPVIENVKISGEAFTGGKLTVSFDTVSGAPDMTKSRVIWYWSDEKDGEFTVIDGENGFEYTIGDEYGDKYITAAVIPANVYEIFGDEVRSEDVLRVITAVDESKLETKLTNVYSTPKDITIIDTASPSKYTFKIAEGVTTADGKADKKSYILLKSVNAKEDDGYFVMLDDGGVDTTEEGSAVNELKKYYPGTYSGTDAAIIAKNYEMPTRTFDASNKKSIAYYLNRDEYMKAQFPVMHEGGYIKDHTWYTEAGILESGEVAYASKSKLALISVTEYLQNVERIGTVGASRKWSVTNFQTRTPHPTVATAKHTSSTYTVPATWLVSSGKSFQAQGVVYIWQTLERPVFYLDKSFFKNVKIEAGANSAVADVLKEIMPYEDMLKMGYTKDELTKMGISENYPTGKNAVIKGHLASGDVVYADYDFLHTGADGKEGATQYQWYISNGDGFEKIDGATGETYVLTDNEIGKTIKVEITPHDTDGNMAKTISAEGAFKVSPSADISFTGADIGGITNIDTVTSINASFAVNAKSAVNVRFYVGVYDKETNKCVAINNPTDTALSIGNSIYPVTLGGIKASANNYIKMFAFSEDDRPLFTIEFFRR